MAPLADSALHELTASLTPARREQFRDQLTACLTLVAPSGMAPADRDEWLRTAWITVQHLPADLLVRGCDVARRTCDHPSKIVATVMREVDTTMAQRRKDLAKVKALVASVKPEREALPDDGRCDPAAAAAILAEFGLASDKDMRAAARVHLGPPRKPTPAELQDIASAMGVAPATGEGLAPVADIAGLTIAEIFAQRDRRMGEALRDDFAGYADDWRAVA